jgi:hypothetical protein
MATAAASDLLSYAERYLGDPYLFGAAGPDKFDCSGFTQYVFHHFGIELPHHAADQAKLGTSVPKSSIQAGDLVFSDWGDGPNSHVGIATSGSQIIDAPHTGAFVRYDTLSPGYLSHVTAVRRMDGVTGAGTGTIPTKGNPDPFGGGGLITPDPGGIGGGAVGNVWDSFLQPVRDIASAATSTKTVADNVVKLWAPTSIVRGFAGLGGILLIIIGLWVLTRDLRG